MKSIQESCLERNYKYKVSVLNHRSKESIQQAENSIAWLCKERSCGKSYNLSEKRVELPRD